MAEVEWAAATDPASMLEFVLGEPVYEPGCEQEPDALEGTSYPRCRVSDRKLRLFAVACHRRLWGLLRDERSRRAIEVAERYADGLATESELRAADQDADTAFARWSARLTANANLVIACWKVAGEAARNTLRNCSTAGHDHSFRFWTYGRRGAEARQAHCELLRDIVGNPFCPAICDPSWLTSDVATLAQGIYAVRAFDRAPILADALQDAGCESALILDHLRGAGQHARGCWAIDLLLGMK